MCHNYRKLEYSSAVTIFKWGKILTQYGLSPGKRLPPLINHLGLTFWLIVYGRFDCILNLIIERVSQSCHYQAGQSCSESSVALIFTTVTNLLLCGWIVSITSKFTYNMKGPSNILSHNRCCGSWPWIKDLSKNLMPCEIHVLFVISKKYITL